MSNFWGIFTAVVGVSEAIIKTTVDKVCEKTKLTKIQYSTIVNVIVAVAGIIFTCILDKPQFSTILLRDGVLLIGGSILVIKYGYDFVKELIEKCRK